MKPTKLVITISLLGLFVFSNCSVADDVKDTIDAVECANMIGNLTLAQSNDRPCSEIIADIDRIERDCEKYLDDDIRASFATARENCSGN